MPILFGAVEMTWQFFRRVRDAVLRDPSSTWSSTQRLVALAVADCLDGDGQARPSVALISKRTALNSRTVQRALARLTGPGGVFDEQEGGSTSDKGRKASVYTLRTPGTVTQVPPAQCRRSDPRHSVTGDTEYKDPRHSALPRSIEGPNTHDAGRRVAARRVRKSPKEASKGSSPSWSREAVEEWARRFPGAVPPGGQIGKALKPLVDRHGWPTVQGPWRRYLAESEARFANPQRFAATFSDWGTQQPEPSRGEGEPRGLVLCPSRDELEARTQRKEAARASR